LKIGATTRKYNLQWRRLGVAHTMQMPTMQNFSVNNKKKWLSIINKKHELQKHQIKAPSVLSEKWDLSIEDTDAYTSKHFRVRPGEIENFLNSNNMSFKHRNNEVVVKTCPL